MSNEKKMAVEYFAKEIFYTIELLKKGYVNDQDLLNSVIVIRDKAKEIEKEKIISAQMDMFHFLNNLKFGMMYLDKREEAEKFAEQYYNETYGGNI